MTVQKCCLTLGWDTIGWENISPDVQILGIDLSPVGESSDLPGESCSEDGTPGTEVWPPFWNTYHMIMTMVSCFQLIWGKHNILTNEGF